MRNGSHTTILCENDRSQSVGSSSNGDQTSTNGQEHFTAYLVGVERIICYELLPYFQTLNSDFYCQQLGHLQLEIDQKQPELANRRGAVFHQDNIRPHTSVDTSVDQDICERGIMKLPLKWQQIIQQNGVYLTQIGQSKTC
ncbi:transposase [Trichonephila clavipes]|nr:transposase [Trichonephila clavipes]